MSWIIKYGLSCSGCKISHPVRGQHKQFMLQLFNKLCYNAFWIKKVVTGFDIKQVVLLRFFLI